MEFIPNFKTEQKVEIVKTFTGKINDAITKNNNEGWLVSSLTIIDPDNVFILYSRTTHVETK